MADNTYDVFLSYSRADARHAAEIDSVLRDKGLKTFFDRRRPPRLSATTACRSSGALPM